MKPNLTEIRLLKLINEARKTISSFDRNRLRAKRSTKYLLQRITIQISYREGI
jgi:hypothetical protein